MILQKIKVKVKKLNKLNFKAENFDTQMAILLLIKEDLAQHITVDGAAIRLYQGLKGQMQI